METPIAIDRDVAETIFGWKKGRPTISRRVGGVVSQITGITPEAGTDLFHLVLTVGVIAWMAKKASGRGSGGKLSHQHCRTSTVT